VSYGRDLQSATNTTTVKEMDPLINQSFL